MQHTIEFDIQCDSCKGTGIYVGTYERSGVGVVCHTCKGTGCLHKVIRYSDFNGIVARKDVRQVYQTNPGIVIVEDEIHRLADFGGMPYKNWFEGKPFPPKSENRRFTCPAWWYQSADSSKKPYWDKCQAIGLFSKCQHFKDKSEYWNQWDKEQQNKAGGLPNE